MQRKSFYLFSIVVLCLIIPVTYHILTSSLAEAATATKPVVLKAITAWPTHVAQNYWYHEFIKEVNARAEKERVPLTIRKLGGPEVVGTYQQFAAMRSGTVDMAYTSGNYFIGETVELNAISCIKVDPDYLYRAFRETKVLDIVNEACRQKSGCIALFPILMGRGGTLLSTKPFRPGDWSGLRIRMSGGNSVVGIPAMGGSGIMLSADEVFEALQRGTIDAVVGQASDRYSFGERKVYKYILMPRFYEASTYWFIAAKVWDELPNNVKSLLKSVAQDHEKAGIPWCRKWDDDIIKKYVEEDNVKLIWCSPEEERKVAKAYRADYMDFIIQKSPAYGPKLADLLKNYIY
ncbi:MAG: hypothetical protein ACE144_07005 [Thermodesulfobacteriota bacterium]